MARVQLWRSISRAGVDSGLDEHLRRKIELTNKLGFTAGVVVFAGNVLFWGVLGADIRIVLVLFAAAIAYAAIPLLNRARRYDLSRGLLTVLPPIFIITAAGIISDAPLLSFKFALLSVIAGPLLVFGIEEPRKMIAGVVWVGVCLAGMDAMMPLIPTLADLDANPLAGSLSVTINATVSCLIFTFSFVYFQRLNLAAERKLEAEKVKSERLLLNVLPREIADTLKESERTIAEHLESASILFADIVGFTPLAARLSPGAVVDLLNELFSEFDRMAERLGVEKIKTIGDCYMAAAGVPRASSDHAHALTRLALAMQAYMTEYRFEGQRLALRIGINSGPVTAGVIGRKKFIYDLWGHTVNVASRMESQGSGGVVQITDATHALIKDDFACVSGGVVNVKGTGEMHVWHVLGARDDRRESR
ncbi:adenylate/guanylate cyclase domain-containing protein [Nannocystis sp. SCPEA4]|uniref:adenylate/guanylate cyclase domain-containing protein n=1 Tax=Nannocystis sp. SCPEA4 TaxID=2996787 RepID=UPI00226E4A25|nr:adenylate/guanylate cyclase domain-containing protein [Nannocystis sp. SCPEA4]MCY1059649.1 adenylate/guanylate cyclase domain-containing protein [Nannocystis sp. SCPEA4]